MADRVFRLSIVPQSAPEVRRVVDFDGRDTLHDVHCAIQNFFELDNDHLYAFYLSGKYFDRATEYGIADDSAHDSSKAVLFRLSLREGQELAYLFDFGDELRHAVTVVSITEVPQPLGEPVLVESVGDSPPQYEEEEPQPLPEYLTEVAPLAENVLTLNERLAALIEEDDAKHATDSADDGEGGAANESSGPPPEIVSALQELSRAALALATALEEDEDALFELDDWSGDRDLLRALVHLPHELVSVGDFEGALTVARAFHFAHPEAYDGDLAVILAESGKRDEALVQLEANLEKNPGSFLTVSKAGEALESLGDVRRAESMYRTAISLAADAEEHEEALSQLFGFLEDTGRAEEAQALLDSPDGEFRDSRPVLGVPGDLPKVGRNDPCPCGSGTKYKKCHGAPS